MGSDNSEGLLFSWFWISNGLVLSLKNCCKAGLHATQGRQQAELGLGFTVCRNSAGRIFSAYRLLISVQRLRAWFQKFKAVARL